MITVDYSVSPYLITIPQSDLTLDTGTKYTLTVDTFWQLLRDYADSEEAIPYPIIYTRIPATASTPSITEVNLDYYQLQFENGAYSVNIINGNTNIRDVEVKNTVSVNTNNTTGFINPTFLESGLFDHAVTYDEINGVAGTGYTASGGIIGTPSVPSNNITDALAIAVSRGFDTVRIKGTANFGATPSLDGWNFIGDNKSISKIIFTNGDTGDCSFKQLYLQGDMWGAIFADECTIGAVTGLGCTTNTSTLQNCLLENNIQLRADNNQRFNLINCSTTTDALIDFDVNGSAGHISILGHQCRIQLKNITAGNLIHFSGKGAEVYMDATCTNGTIEIHGNVAITNSGTLTIEDDTSQALAWEHLVDGAYTAEEVLRGVSSALLSKVSGMNTNSPIFRDINDLKNRITATTDSKGNRTAITLDLS